MSRAVRLSFSAAEVDLATGRYTLADGVTGRLTATERVTLVVLVANRGSVVSRETLFAATHAGMTPDRQGLRAVDQAVSRLRRRVFPGGGIEAVRGHGYRLDIWPEEADPSDSPAWRGRPGEWKPKSLDPGLSGDAAASGSGRRNAPELFGRQTELALVETELAMNRRPVRHVELIGAGGIGKTTLARVVFERALAREEKAAWVLLDGALTLVEVLMRISGALGFAVEVQEGRAELAAKLDTCLEAHPRTLLVLDDVDMAQDLFGELGLVLPALAQTRVLLTARRSHGGSWCGGRGVTTMAIGPLAPDDALRLLEARLMSTRGPVASADERARLLRLVEQVGGWPLALELALVSPIESTGLIALTPVLEAMWRALGREEQVALKFIALAHGTLVAYPARPGTDGMMSLQRGGWLGPRRHERLELHALVRDFVMTRVGPEDQAAFLEHLGARARHLLEQPLSMDPRIMAELSQLAPTLWLALELGVPADDSVVLALARHHHLQGPRERALEVAEVLKERCERAQSRALYTARALLLLGARHGDAGRADAEVALALATTTAERSEALALVARTHREDPEAALAALREAIRLAPTPLERAKAESVLAASLAREERFDDACAPMMRAVDMLERLAVETRFAEVNFLAFIVCECGMSAQARRLWDEAEAAYRAHTRRPVRPGFMAVRALISTDEGDFARADRELEYVIAHGGEMGRPALAAQAVVWRIVLALLSGRVEQARASANQPFAHAKNLLEPPDRALLFALQAMFADDPQPLWEAARGCLGSRFPSTLWFIEVVSGKAPEGLPPSGLRARVASRVRAVLEG